MPNKFSDKVSKTLTSRRFEAASTFAGSKTINVSDGGKTYSVAKTPANLRYIRNRLGKGQMQKYRGKNRIIWLDPNIY